MKNYFHLADVFHKAREEKRLFLNKSELLQGLVETIHADTVDCNDWLPPKKQNIDQNELEKDLKEAVIFLKDSGKLVSIPFNWAVRTI